MCLKTLKREVYSAKNIPRDPMKIDESYHYLKAQEMRNAELEAQAEIDASANRIIIDADVKEAEPTAELPQGTINTVTGECIPEAPQTAAEDTSESATAVIGTEITDGPDF